MLGLAIPDAARRARWRGHGTAAPPPAPISAVAADGWQAAMIAPADLALSAVALSRQGFDASGAPATHAETVRTTKRVRQPWPNQGVLTADTVALSDYVYATDAIAGVANASAEVSPKPIANWSSTDRRVVGDTITVGVTAFHRNARAGKPVAWVVFRASDGAATVTATAAAPTATVDPLTGLTILEYVATLDISALAAGAIAVNARVYPWIGAAASVLDSADQASQWQFSPRGYVRNGALAAAPNLVYVKAGGSDAAGYVGPDAGSANAAPCATVTGAINRARAVLGTAAGALNGLRVRLDAGTWSRSANPTANTVAAEIVIEPIPGVARASCVFEFGAANNSVNLAHVRYKGLTIRRQGAFYLHSLAGGTCVVEDCAWDWNGNTGQLGTAAANHYFVNVAFTAVSATALGSSSGVIMAMIRGCTGGAANSAADIEMIHYIGNAMAGGRLGTAANRAQDNVVIAFNRFIAVGNATSVIVNATVGTALVGLALVQNVFEWTSTASQRSFMPSGDGDTLSTSHVLCWHNSFVGFFDLGRGNILYDETSGTLRTHKLQSFVGNIHVQINTKSDVFCGVSSVPSPASHLGNWAYGHGVGCRGEFSRYKDAGGAGFAQDYPGLAAKIGTGGASPGQDPLFVGYQAVTAGPVAGAGGGDYALQAGSPARGMVADSPLPSDLAGNVRSGTAAAGAYA